MNPRDRIRRQWTHRRLGLGSAQPTDLELAHTEALLAAVGARRAPAAASADRLEVALFDFVCDTDLAAGVPAIEAVPVPLTALRAALPAARRTRLTRRLLIPAATSGVAAIAIAISALFAGSSAPTSPALTATAESRQLLSHADTLLTAASHATADDRARLVTEAKADLSHVSRLLPLAAPEARSEIRERMTALDQRAQPLSVSSPRPTAATRNDSSSDGAASTDGLSAPQSTSATTDSGTGSGDGTGTPVYRRPISRPPASGSAGDGTVTAAPVSSGGTSSGDPTPAGIAPRPRPTTAGGRAPRGSAQDGAPQGMPQQQPPRGGAPPPRP